MMGKQRANVSQNYIFYMLQEAATLLSTIVVTPYISRILGADNIGIYSYTHSIVSYITLFGALGATLYGRREIAACGQNVHQRSVVFYNIVVLKVFSTLLSLSVYFVIFNVIGEYQTLFCIQSIEVIAVVFEISWLYQGENRFQVCAVLAAVCKVLLAISVFAFVKTQNDLPAYCFCVSSSVLFLNVAMWSLKPKAVERVSVSELQPLSILKPVLALFIPQIAIQIYQVMDKTMLYAITQSAAESGYYEQSHKIINIATLLMTARGVAVSPRLSALYANHRDDKIRSTLGESFQFVWFIGLPLVFGLIMLSNYFVPWYFGQGYDRVTALMQIFAPICLIIGLSNLLTVYYIALKRSKQIAIAAFAGAGANLLLNAILIPRIQAAGAAIASVFAEFLILCIWFFIVRRQVPMRIVFQGVFKKIPCAAIAFVVPMILIPMDGGVGFFALGAMGILLYLLLLVVVKDSYTLDIFGKIRRTLLGKES